MRFDPKLQCDLTDCESQLSDLASPPVRKIEWACSLWQQRRGRLTRSGDILDVQVAGPAPGAVESALGETPPKSFTVHGPLPWDRSLELVESADFSLVLREGATKRNRLGFPSKVPESLLLGTPILGNAVGDLGTYLVDGRNSAMTNDTSVPALLGTLERVLGSEGGWNRDRIKSDAEEWFSPRAHAERLGAFMSDVRELR